VLVSSLTGKEIAVEFAQNIETAIGKLTSANYRFIAADLAIPLNDKFLGTKRAFDPAIEENPAYLSQIFAPN
jgi:hypothetical protein